MLQPAGDSTAAQPVIKAGNTTIKAVDIYLGSILSSDALADDDINTRLSNASCASVGCLSVFGMINGISDWTPKLPSTRQPF